MSGILVATHGGASADGAVRVATALAGRLGAPLVIVSVLEPRPTVDAGAGIPYVGIPEDDDRLAREMRLATTRQLARCVAPGVAEIRRGVAAREIDAAARASGAGLIVVGLGPHRFIDRALGTETALRLIRTASVPVLAIAPDAHEVPGRILAAVDFSETSVRTVRMVARWLRAGDELVLAHALPGALEAILTLGESAARLERLARSLALSSGVIVRDVILEGEAATALDGLATRMSADAIALGSHGYGPWKRLTLGSVATRLLRHARQSVLVTPRSSLHGHDHASESDAERDEARHAFDVA